MVEITVGANFDLTSVKKSKFRPIVGMGGLLAIVFCAFLCWGGLQLASSTSVRTVAADGVKAPKTPTTAQSAAVITTASPAQPPQATAPQATGPVQTCVPYMASLAPSQIDLRIAPDGLTQVVDTPNFYQIYGTDAATLRSQIQHCAPKSGATTAQYTAQTIYRISWQYSYARDTASMCHVVHAKVGVHVGQVLPLWQPTATADAGLPGAWQAFVSALRTHEDGHTTLDERYAQTLLSDLQSFPSTACDQLPGLIQHLANSDIGELDQANDNYDSSTTHGATQGAILP